MKNKTINQQLIDTEIQKIETGDRDANDLLQLVYLNSREQAIRDSLSSIGSSREKDEEIYKWRYAVNKATWYESCLLQRKGIALQAKIDEIEKLKTRDFSKYESLAGKIEKLKAERDEAKAAYYTKINDYDSIYNQCQQIESFGINLSDLKLEGAEILKLVSKLNETERLNFWNSYFKLEDKFIVKDEPSGSTPSTFGE